MGCNSSKPNTKFLKPKNARDLAYENRLSPMLNPTHDLNVNKKYSYLYYLIPNEYTNEGIKRTLKYVSLAEEKVLEEKKREFWG